MIYCCFLNAEHRLIHSRKNVGDNKLNLFDLISVSEVCRVYQHGSEWDKFTKPEVLPHGGAPVQELPGRKHQPPGPSKQPKHRWHAHREKHHCHH